MLDQKKNIAIGFEALSDENFRGRNPTNFTPPRIPEQKNSAVNITPDRRSGSGITKPEGQK